MYLFMKLLILNHFYGFLSFQHGKHPVYELGYTRHSSQVRSGTVADVKTKVAKQKKPPECLECLWRVSVPTVRI